MRISDSLCRLVLRLFLLLLPLVWGTEAEASRIAGISRAEADSLGRQTVIYNGLPVTFNTLSRDLLKKVSGRVSYRGLTAEQTVASMRLFPMEWKDEPLILVKDEELRRTLGVKANRVALSALFDADGSYRVETLYAGAEGKRLHAVEELDEKAGILLGIISGQMIVRDENLRLPEWKVDLELLYNRIPLLRILFILLFSGAVASGWLWLYGSLRRKSVGYRRLTTAVLTAAFLISLIEFAVEWILIGRIPLANMGETLNFTLLVGLGVMLWLLLSQGGRGEGRKIGEGIWPLALFFWGCVALVSWIIGENPIVTPLMPALQSPWLSIHVTLVMVSYSLLAITFIFSLIGVWSREAGERLRRPCMMTLLPGVGFLVAGIVTGSIWAKDAWGAYWSWDPKETWALVTLILYSLPLLVKLRGRWLYIYLLLAFLSLLMTYFGVSYLLGGRHSYV